MMKRAGKVILLIGIVYGVFAFITLEYAFSEWSEFVRVLFLLAVMAILAANYPRKTKINKFD